MLCKAILAGQKGLVPQIFPQRRQLGLPVLQAQVIHRLQLVRVALHPADLDGAAGADDKILALGFQFLQAGDTVIIHIMPVQQLVPELGMVAKIQLDGTGGHGLLPIVHVPGQDYQLLFIAHPRHGVEGDAVGHAAVQIAAAINLHRPGDEGHGAGGTEDFHGKAGRVPASGCEGRNTYRYD